MGCGCPAAWPEQAVARTLAPGAHSRYHMPVFPSCVPGFSP